MEQRIQFCQTTDGVTLAYTIVGQGYPLVRVVGGMTHLEYEWQSPIWRETIEGLARDFELIRYDGRGMGLSDRGPMAHDVDTWTLDVEAVIEATGREKVALLGISQGGATANQPIRCATRSVCPTWSYTAPSGNRRSRSKTRSAGSSWNPWSP